MEHPVQSVLEFLHVLWDSNNTFTRSVSKRMHNKRGHYMQKLLLEIAHRAPLAVGRRNNKTRAGECARINSWRESIYLSFCVFSIASIFPWCYIIISYNIMYFSFYFYHLRFVFLLSIFHLFIYFLMEVLC